MNTNQKFPELTAKDWLIRNLIWSQEAEKHRRQGSVKLWKEHLDKAEYAWQKWLLLKNYLGSDN